MRYLILDCETTGLPPKNSNWEKDYKHFPYLVSLSWQVYKDETLISESSHIIKPDNYIIPSDVIRIHKISNEIAKKDGKSVIFVLNELKNDLKGVDKIVGHNIYFDTSIIKANVKRYKCDIDIFIKGFDKSKRIDTMQKTIKFVGLNKWPKLTELYFKLFKSTFNAHNSLEDVKATAKCFFKLKELGVL